MISPCVTFNDHEGSTKSYAYTREHDVEVVQADFVPLRDPIDDRLRRRHDARASRCTTAASSSCARSPRTTTRPIAMRAYAAIRDHQRKGEVMTGLLYISPDSKDVHDQNETVPRRSTTFRTTSSVRVTTRCRS